MEQKNCDTYYRIHVSYEIPYNVIDSHEPGIVKARENLFLKIKTCIPEKYEKFSTKLVLHQLQDTFNYLVTFTAFFRSTDGLPMEEYVFAREIKENVQKELEDFFDSVDCEYKQINIKTFV
jgi:hypothetical protein